MNSEKTLYELVTSPCTVRKNLIFPNDDVVWVTWKNSEDNIAAGSNVIVAFAAYVTSMFDSNYTGNLVNCGKVSCTVKQTVVSSFKM